MQLQQPDWAKLLSSTLDNDNFKQLSQFVEDQYCSDTPIYPPKPLIFNALELTPPESIKVVILGQDPYHGPGQAHGLAFSINDNCKKLPPSLKNIFKELEADLGQSSPSHGDLTEWAKQGVLLLNTVLTVEHKQAHSHKNKGWEQVTDDIISGLNQVPQTIIFLLWGAHAQAKEALIDQSKHTILKAPHPSPLSAHRGFFGCGHFSKTNQLLEANGHSPINWVHSRINHQSSLFDDYKSCDND